MALMEKAQLREFIKENNLKTTEDIQNALKEMFKSTLEEMPEAELGDSLGYDKNDSQKKKTSNRRNSNSKKPFGVNIVTWRLRSLAIAKENSNQ